LSKRATTTLTSAQPATPRLTRDVDVDGRRVTITSPDKPLFAAEGLTKSDVVDYYRRIANYVLPYLKDRPVSLHVLPEGLSSDPGKKHWLKNVSGVAPDWLAVMPYKTGKGELYRWPVINDEASLLWAINEGTIDLHPWLSRADEPGKPDWAVFDLDPAEGATFAQVLKIAELIKTKLDALGLRSCPKLSGQTGVQICVPLIRQYTFDQVRAWTRRLAARVAEQAPQLVTNEWRVNRRTGRVRIRLDPECAQ
jgi:bifunctional non-homologous end joining protein LigD